MCGTVYAIKIKQQLSFLITAVFFVYERCHADGLKSRSIGKISSRPTIILNERTSFDNEERLEKLPAGPTMPIPGPTLLTQVKAALKDSPKERLSRVTTRVTTRIIII